MIIRRLLLALFVSMAMMRVVVAQDYERFRYIRRSIRTTEGVIPPHGIVPNEKDAIALAKLVFPVVLPKALLKDVRFAAQEEAGTWMIIGTSARHKAGELVCEIRRKDGAVLYVGFTE